MVDFIVCMCWFRWLRRSGRSCGPGPHLQRTYRPSDGLVEHLAHGMSVMQFFLVSCALWRWYISSSVGLISSGNRSSSSEGRQEVSFISQDNVPFSTGLSCLSVFLVFPCTFVLYYFLCIGTRHATHTASSFLGDCPRSSEAHARSFEPELDRSISMSVSSMTRVHDERVQAWPRVEDWVIFFQW